MFRLSRIHAPRATFVAAALVAMTLIAFGAVATTQLPEGDALAADPRPAETGTGAFVLTDVFDACGLLGKLG